MVSELKSSRENICTLIIHHISKKIFLISHIKNIYENVKNSKINQSIFKSSWVPNLAKCMHVMCEIMRDMTAKLQDGYRKQCYACES